MLAPLEPESGLVRPVCTAVPPPQKKRGTIMKRFLFVAACASLAPLAAAAPPMAPGHVSLIPSEIEWKDAPSIGPGAKIAVLEGNLKENEPITFRLRLPPNARIAEHTHPVAERVTVISGTFHLGVGEKFEEANARAYPAGSVTILPAGMPMYAFTRSEGAEIQLHGTGPWGIQYLDDAKTAGK
jgi:quercetin dioxygenase-like cupin family protein